MEADANNNSALDPDFWRGRRVLVTGHRGFKGAWLTLWLSQLGARVACYGLSAPTTPSMFELACVGRDLEAQAIADICDVQRLGGALAEFQPEVVFHLASQTIVSTSYKRPFETMRSNILGTATLLDQVANTGSVQSVICVTSDKCYEPNSAGDAPGYKETDALGGGDPYSASKACQELVVRGFAACLGDHVNLATARTGNVIGGGDWAKDRLIPDFIRAVTHDEPFIVRSPDGVRPWQHVLNPLLGYLQLAERLTQSESYCGAWNFGPPASDALTVRQIVEGIHERWQKPDASETRPEVTSSQTGNFVTDSAAEIRWHEASTADLSADEPPSSIQTLEPPLTEVKTLLLDSEKATQELAWRPKWDLPTGLDQTIGWYRAYHAGSDIRKVTLDQIDSYGN